MQSFPPVAVTSASAVPVIASVRKVAFIQNDGPNAAYIGGENVLSTTGLTLLPGAIFTIDQNMGGVWAICAAAETASLRTMGQV